MKKNLLLNKDAIRLLPFIIFIEFFVIILLINYSPSSTGPSASAAAQNTQFFAIYKVLLSAGFSLTLTGGLLNSTSALPMYTYSKSNSSYLFTNHWLTTAFKIIVISIGLTLCVLSFIYEPESESPCTFWEYVLAVLGVFFITGIAIQIINSVRGLIQNRGDYIFIDDDKVEWYDDKYKSAKEIKFSDIKSCERILEKTKKYPEIIGILFNFGKEDELKIDFESMSFIPQSKHIYEIIWKKHCKIDTVG